MFPSRRTVLQAGLAACLVAGCVSNDDEAAATPTGDSPAGGNPSTDEATSPTGTENGGTGTAESPTSTPNPEIDCTTAHRPVYQAEPADEVEPLEYPPPPDGDVDAEWVVDHEKAYVRNENLADHDLKEWHGTSISDTETESAGDGVIVRVSYSYGFATEEAIADSPTINVAYYANDQGVLRAERSGTPTSDRLDPRREGEPVVCF